MTLNWALIGLGEVGGRFAEALKASGDNVRAYVRHPRAINKVDLAPDIPTLLSDADAVISCVWASAAEDVAKQAAQTTAKAIYIDVTNSGIATTDRIAEALRRTGLQFHKASIMAPVARHGAQAPILLAGPQAMQLSGALNARGFNARPVGTEPRQAVAIKILRSLVTKCIVALLHDMTEAGRRYGIEAQLLDSAAEFFAAEPFPELARTLLRQSEVHAERLAQEMDEIAEALAQAGVPDRVPALAREVFQEIARRQAAMRS